MQSQNIVISDCEEFNFKQKPTRAKRIIKKCQTLSECSTDQEEDDPALPLLVFEDDSDSFKTEYDEQELEEQESLFGLRTNSCPPLHSALSTLSNPSFISM